MRAARSSEAHGMNIFHIPDLSFTRSGVARILICMCFSESANSLRQELTVPGLCGTEEAI